VNRALKVHEDGMLEEESPAASEASRFEDKEVELEAIKAKRKGGAKDKQASAYDALASFNRGAEQRRSRKQVVQEAPRSQVYGSERGDTGFASESKSEADFAGRADTDAAAESESGAIAIPYAERSMAKQPKPVRPSAARVARSAVAVRSPSAPAPMASPKSVPDVVSDARVRIILDPMRGIALDPKRLLLYRTVLVDGVGYRQGLLIDTAALGRWLEDTLIAPSGLAELISVRFGEGEDVEAGGEGYALRHGFAAPFTGFEASLRVAPLAGGGEVWTIHALVGLLVFVGLIGLLAIDRMASVVIEFAERRSNFVAAVSHELKTPLTAIRMYAEMLRDGMTESEAKRQTYYATITDESERLSRLIDNVLEFSRLERGDRTFSMTVGALGDAVTEAAQKLQPHVERAGFVLDVEVEAGLPPVRFDPDALTQMVFNLIDNAMKYAAQCDERRVVLRCSMQSDGCPAVSVRDFGPGIRAPHLKRIFEPFYRVEAELTRTTKGSGIGLALVKDLGEAMGARVRGVNAEGGGFEVSIAFARIQA
jgi:two-component system sensor histidine kinase VicK